MIQMMVIGFLGKDAEVKIHGSEAVINFSVAHTDKWIDNGVKKERTTWVNCSWWTESNTVAQYMKKGTQVYVSGIPEAKIWKKREGEPQPFLNLRVYSMQLLGGQRRDGDSNNQETQNTSTQTKATKSFDSPYSNQSSEKDDDLPF